MRYAVKVAYDGSLFHGSQIQNGPRTVEGDIKKVLSRICDGEEAGSVQFSSRTDAGVSSLGNVFSINTEMDIDGLIRGMNSELEGIWSIAHGKMREHQNIRWANSRWYRYHLPPKTVRETERISDALRTFMGEHDFSKFSKVEDGKDPVSIIERATAQDIAGNGEMVVVDIVGNRFLWNQVRRMVGAAVSVSRGEMEVNDIQYLLQGKDGKNIATMPSTGLVLMDVMFKDIDFIIDRKAVEIAMRRYSEKAWESSIKVLLQSALRSML